MNFLTGLQLGILVLAILAVGSIVLFSLRTGTPPAASMPAARDRIVAAVPRDFAGTIVEAGAGWGTLAVALAGARPRSRVVAYEISPVPFLVLWLRALRHPNLEVRQQDFLKVSLARADMVVLYLCGTAAERLGGKLARECPLGTPVISNTFRIGGWTPERVEEVGHIACPWLYHYRTPPPDDRPRGRRVDRAVG